MRSRRLSTRRKAQILKELLESGSSVRKLSETYNVARESLYRWRKHHRQKNLEKVEVNTNGSRFVEVSIKESESSIRKASLVFNKFSISINGELSSGQLLGIIKLLEGPC